MQDENKDFDLLIRSMLEDAEERPSRGVWKAISSRLDESASGHRETAVSWLKWAGASLAFAAALALGLFFRGTEPTETLHLERGIAQLSAPATAIRTDIKPAAPLRSMARHTQSDPFVTEAPSVSGIAQNGQSTTDETGSTAEASNQGRGKWRKWKKAEPHNEDFDLLAMDESQNKAKAGGLSLYAKGSIGGNDSDFRFATTHTSLAPGANDTGITEQSTSTYGVPLTLGLGLRYYVLPRLSIGTGIDYSLLTRTFTGKYSGVSSVTGEYIQEGGSVSHSLQYIGIPLGLYYDILSTDVLKLHVYGLGEAERCISSKYTLFASPNIVHSEHVEKLQYSVGGGLGIEFSLSRTLGLYIDPGIRYYFPSDQPKSIRTDKPVMVNFDAGLRFNF